MPLVLAPSPLAVRIAVLTSRACTAQRGSWTRSHANELRARLLAVVEGPWSTFWNGCHGARGVASTAAECSSSTFQACAVVERDHPIVASEAVRACLAAPSPCHPIALRSTLVSVRVRGHKEPSFARFASFAFVANAGPASSVSQQWPVCGSAGRAVANRDALAVVPIQYERRSAVEVLTNGIARGRLCAATGKLIGREFSCTARLTRTFWFEQRHRRCRRCRRPVLPRGAPLRCKQLPLQRDRRRRPAIPTNGV
jgi:hypothetical protein